MQATQNSKKYVLVVLTTACFMFQDFRTDIALVCPHRLHRPQAGQVGVKVKNENPSYSIEVAKELGRSLADPEVKQDYQKVVMKGGKKYDPDMSGNRTESGEPDDSICPVCKNSTYVGETISCDTCM